MLVAFCIHIKPTVQVQGHEGDTFIETLSGGFGFETRFGARYIDEFRFVLFLQMGLPIIARE